MDARELKIKERPRQDWVSQLRLLFSLVPRNGAEF